LDVFFCEKFSERKKAIFSIATGLVISWQVHGKFLVLRLLLLGGQVGLHSARQISAGAQNFTATSEAGAGGSMRQNMIKAHA